MVYGYEYIAARGTTTTTAFTFDIHMNMFNSYVDLRTS
jgi:hypothetical protein